MAAFTHTIKLLTDLIKLVAEIEGDNYANFWGWKIVVRGEFLSCYGFFATREYWLDFGNFGCFRLGLGFWGGVVYVVVIYGLIHEKACFFVGL